MSNQIPTRFKLIDVKLTRSGPEITLRVANPNPAVMGTDIVIGLDDAVEVYPATVSVTRL